MTNKDISKILQRTASFMELHGENPFKVRSYTGTAFQIEKLEIKLSETATELYKDHGISAGMASKIAEIVETGTYSDLEKLTENTPKGVIDMLGLKGIGAKKIRTIWQELGIETLQQLKEACQEGKIAVLKGFGDKTQKLIIEQIDFKNANAGKLHYAKAETFALELQKHLKETIKDAEVEIAGQIRRNAEIVDILSLVVSAADSSKVKSALSELNEIEYQEKSSSPFVWKGIIKENDLKVEVHMAQPDQFTNELFLQTAAPAHLAIKVGEEGKPLRSLVLENNFTSEESIYEQIGWSFIPPELREGTFEAEAAKNNSIPQLIEEKDLKGILHNHSTYSDGQNSLREMAEHCKELGYEYLGITDHSKTAFYANGLTEDRIKQQHEEIDKLNEELAPFKIFKGIESDILTDGSLDYADDVLASFDFIVASIHGNLKMTEEKAMMRLLKAIENPYTTILGHMTGRLLLKREGYPVNHEKIIEACAKHNVVIEINSHPWRLDIDWRWVRPALDAGVMLSLNPDAHETAGYQDMRYGLLVGRKGGLTAAQNLNSLSKEEIEKYFNEKKGNIK